jgi:SacI homology domain
VYHGVTLIWSAVTSRVNMIHKTIAVISFSLCITRFDVNVSPIKVNHEQGSVYTSFVQEILKMFNDSESFYYCPAGDLTNSVQRQHLLGNKKENNIPRLQPDDRFFWNRHMLHDLVETDVGYQFYYYSLFFESYLTSHVNVSSFMKNFLKN